MAYTPTATPLLATDPGVLFWTTLGSPIPTMTAAGGVFTDTWSSEWIALGATVEGSTFNFQTSFDTITVAELLDPVKYVETGRTGSFAFALESITAANLKRALNGGTIVKTGTGDTTVAKYTPPKSGQSTRCMIGWESQDSTERLIAYQCVNTGQVSIRRGKGTANATLPIEYGLELPQSGDPFGYWTAGAARAGV